MKKTRNELMNKTIRENGDDEEYISVEKKGNDLERNIDNSNEAMILDGTDTGQIVEQQPLQVFLYKKITCIRFYKQFKCWTSC